MSIEYVLAIPFEKKDSMKTKYGIKWNALSKMWCAKNEADYIGLSKYHVVKVIVSYMHKDKFKEMGGQWNGVYNYVHRGLYKKHKDELDMMSSTEEPTLDYSSDETD